MGGASRPARGVAAELLEVTRSPRSWRARPMTSPPARKRCAGKSPQSSPRRRIREQRMTQGNRALAVERRAVGEVDGRRDAAQTRHQPARLHQVLHRRGIGHGAAALDGSGDGRAAAANAPRPSVVYLSFQECTGCLESLTPILRAHHRKPDLQHDFAGTTTTRSWQRPAMPPKRPATRP